MPDMNQKLDRSTAKILTEAAGESKRTFAEVKRRRELRSQEVEGAVLKEAYEYIHGEAAYIQSEAGRGVSRHMLENKRALYLRRTEMVQEIFVLVQAKIAAFTRTTAYGQRFTALLAKAPEQLFDAEGVLVTLRGDDLSLREALAVSAPQVRLTFREEDFRPGGLITESPDLGLRVDSSFDNVVGELSGHLVELFGLSLSDEQEGMVLLMNQTHYTIHDINGPVIKVTGGKGPVMMDMVSAGEEGLIGEVVSVDRSAAIVQVYEDIAGPKPGQPAVGQGALMAITLGPGMLTNIFDGIARPLKVIEAESGPFIGRGLNIPSLGQEKTWDVTLRVKAGDVLVSDALYASCPGTPPVTHRCLVSAGMSGRITKVALAEAYRVGDTLVELTDDHGQIHPLALVQRWPICTPRPITQRLPIDRPLVIGQRITDTLFPIGKGGIATTPNPSGAGKTMTQHQLAEWPGMDIIVYLGCGEHGNEMTQALEELSELLDPKSQQPLMNRAILIANTSNMPVVACEMSVYTGITIAEYYRDVGYYVAPMADSTSRWAEALREISGRLEEMPAEEGFPAYLASHPAEFYEWAGYMKTLEGKGGSVTVIGAVSPQGGDFPEPVTQNTKRYVCISQGLDRVLAYARHFPSVNWPTSYLEYADDLRPWYNEHVEPEFVICRHQMAHLLQKKLELMEIVKFIGMDIPPEDRKLIIETAKLLRVDFLQQNAYHAVDTYVPLDKQLCMMELILKLYHRAKDTVSRAIPLSQLKETGTFESLTKIKHEVPNDGQEKSAEYNATTEDALWQVNEANR